jgi:hypothetical protein
MSEYKTIHGIHIQALDTDPSNLGAGQVWYNTTSNQLKITAVSTTGSWATGGNMATGKNSRVVLELKQQVWLLVVKHQV